MVVAVHPEDGEGLSGDVGTLLQPVRLDDRADARAEALHLHLEGVGHRVLREVLQRVAREPPVVPQPMMREISLWIENLSSLFSFDLTKEMSSF